jgi:RIO kinase 1
MKTPRRIEPLIQDGLVDEVIRQLMSGKEAKVYVVRCGDEIRCAKVYKEADQRSFRQSVDYTEGRKVKNSRRARAMEKGTRYGRKAQEEAWQSAEVDALQRLAAAGVRVPRPYNFLDGVLLMELVTGDNGEAAPRLNDLVLSPELAREYHRIMITQVVRMLCAGIIHGDLSEYNVLVGHHRSAPGGRCRRQQQCLQHARARCGQPGHLLRPVCTRVAGYRLWHGDMVALPERQAKTGKPADRPLRTQREAG